MKKLFWFVVVLFTSVSAFSQTDTTSIGVPFIAYWSAGDSYNFRITKIVQEWDDGKFTENENQVYVANFTVMDSTEKSYTIKWNHFNDLENTFDVPKSRLKDFAKYEKIDVVYKTSEFGSLLEIVNWKEIGEKMGKLYDDLYAITDKRDKQIRAAQKELKKVYSSKHGI